MIKPVVLDVKVFLVILNTQQAHHDAYHKKKIYIC